MFTIPAQRQLPYLVIASPKDEQELRALLRTALAQDHPFALHYPRDAGFGLPSATPPLIPVGQAEVLREGRDVLLVGFGPIVARVMAAATALEADGWSAGVINARFAKPLDRQLILDQARGKRLIVTFEESVVTGGFGSGVLEAVEEARLTDPAYRGVAVRIVGILPATGSWITGRSLISGGCSAWTPTVRRTGSRGPRRPAGDAGPLGGPSRRRVAVASRSA